MVVKRKKEAETLENKGFPLDYLLNWGQYDYESVWPNSLAIPIGNTGFPYDFLLIWTTD